MRQVPVSFGFDLWMYRNPEKATVSLKIFNLCQRVPSWQGIADYHQDAILWRLRRLPPNYQVIQKNADSFWLNTVRLELRVRARHGIFAQWYQTEVKAIMGSL